MENDFTPLDPFAVGIAAMRAAEATPESRFAEQHRANRLRELAAEHSEHAAAATPIPRLTAAQLAEFEPPDSWAEGIKALKEAR